ncbi:MAG: NAD(P)-dependent oxidoreductase, partial [Geminicoccaceae bacterium]
MTILVTGASGFVGAALVEDLVSAGETVIGLDRQSPPPELLSAVAAGPGRAAWHKVDVTDRRALAEAFAGAAVRAVIHTATITAGEVRDRTDPAGIVAVNVNGTLAVLETCRDHGVGRFVLASSNAAYGRTVFEPGPLREACPVDPVSMYEITKFAAERAALRLGELHGIDVRIARLSSVFGPWERATGVRDTLSPLLQVVRLAARGESARLPRPHYRDWIYVRDVAAGLRSLVALPAAAPRLFNLGPGVGQGFTTLAWGERLRTDWPDFDCRLAAPGEAANIDVYLPHDRAPLAIDRLLRWTDFRPRYGLDAAAADYLAWLRQYPSGLAETDTSLLGFRSTLP